MPLDLVSDWVQISSPADKFSTFFSSVQNSSNFINSWTAYILKYFIKYILWDAKSTTMWIGRKLKEK